MGHFIRWLINKEVTKRFVLVTSSFVVMNHATWWLRTPPSVQDWNHVLIHFFWFDHFWSYFDNFYTLRPLLRYQIYQIKSNMVIKLWSKGWLTWIDTDERLRVRERESEIRWSEKERIFFAFFPWIFNGLKYLFCIPFSHCNHISRDRNRGEWLRNTIIEFVMVRIV